MQDSLRESPLVLADVGAAMGLERRWQPVTEFLEVISFEPDARSDADGTVYRTALGAEENSSQTLHLTQLPAASSFYKNHPGMDRFVVRDWLQNVGETQVPVTTLDACLGDKQINFLKIDVEGADLDVLHGAEKSLDSVLGIQIEVSFASRHQDAPFFSEIEIFLRERGFRLHSICHESWLRENAAFGANVQPQLIWGDAVFLRDELQEGDHAKWALICQAYGFHDFALDQLPESWHSTIRDSIRRHPAFFFMAGWRLMLITALLPFLWGKAWRKWKPLAASIFGELHRIANRTGPKRGIFTGD